MYDCMDGWMHVWLYVHVRTIVCLEDGMFVWRFLCMTVCMYDSMCVWLYVCRIVRSYDCMYLWLYECVIVCV